MRNEGETITHRHHARRDDYESGVNSTDRMELRVWLRLITCFNLLDSAVRQSLHQDHSTTLPRFDVLAQLYRTSTPMSMGDLSRRLMVTNANITGLISRLTREGLGDRRPSSQDRRRQIVELTTEGRRLFEAMAEDHREWLSDMTAGLDHKEMTELFRLLGRLKESVLHSRDGEETST